jgi:hypothetical protein
LLSAHDQARILSGVLGKPLQCIDVPPSAAADGMRKGGAPDWLANGLSELWQAVRDGKGGLRTQEVERLTGRAAQTFEAWCQEHRAAFL